ncbi:MAG: nuclease [Candidimonas sp.]|nr:nuclease [Candidimonas sp.]
MDKRFKLPPQSKNLLTPPEEIASQLSCLIGHPFELTYKSRTDGSNIRKLVARTLANGSLPAGAPMGSYRIMPPKGKGVPKILLEYLDTYIVTTGASYNLQVWNRNPNIESVQVQYDDGSKLLANEVRFVLVKIDPDQNVVSGVLVLTPDYIVGRYGKFGKPTVKSQMIISSRARQTVFSQPNSILFYDDEIQIGSPDNQKNLAQFNIHQDPSPDSLLPLSTIREIVMDKLIGQHIPPASTKTRGQTLEGMVARALGYNVSQGDLLAGGLPDIKNQALEVKLQDSPTVDLGLYSPEFEDPIKGCGDFTTRNMRYLIVLTNPNTYCIDGIVLCPGSRLGLHFTYVPEQSFKCQRSIPMSFFEEHKGSSVFNP